MSSSDIVLTYFDGRGLGEGVRLMLALGGETWTEVPVKTRADFVKLRDVDQVLPYGQLPLLDFKGVRLVGSQPIVRYLGATHGLYGSTPEERYEADAAQDFARDLFSKVSGVSWVAPERLDAHINDVLKPLIAKFLPWLEKRLAAQEWLAGHLSFADVTLFEAIDYLVSFGCKEHLSPYPNVLAHTDRFAARVKHYLDSPLRRPHATAEYKAEVNASLQR